MKVSKINSTQNFNAKLCGDIQDIIKISKAAGLSIADVHRHLLEVHEAVPYVKDRVFFIFREIENIGLCDGEPPLRSQIQILKAGDPFNLRGLRLNINPYKGGQKDLLKNMVEGVKNLVAGKVQPERQKNFAEEGFFPWTRKIRDILKTGRVNFDEGLEKAVKK